MFFSSEIRAGTLKSISNRGMSGTEQKKLKGRMGRPSMAARRSSGRCASSSDTLTVWEWIVRPAPAQTLSVTDTTRGTSGPGGITRRKPSPSTEV